MLLTLLKTCGQALLPRPRPAKPAHRTCLTFSVDGLRFGLDTRLVQQIARYQLLAQPRGLPPCVRGLYRHRGLMLPVIDLAARHGHAPLVPGGRTCIVIVELGLGRWRKEVGLLVDEVCGLTEFAAAELRPMPEVVHKMIEVELIEGLVKLERDYLAVLDPWKLLSDEEAAEIADYLREL